MNTLIITSDEHGEYFNHVPPPGDAAPPDDSLGEYGFDFNSLLKYSESSWESSLF
jgi:phospholipase C